MISEDAQLPLVYLKAGEMFFSKEPSFVMTVLGSCLCVTMLHRRTGFAAVCHGLLPRCAARECGAQCLRRAAYVECAIRWMAARFREAGVNLRELEVKVFGGADMFGVKPAGKGAAAVGKLNILTALRTLEEEKLLVACLDTGGNQGRKIFFNTRTGEVFRKLLPPSALPVPSEVRK